MRLTSSEFFAQFDLLEPHDRKSSCVLALGTFDGVHLGHREILRATIEKSTELNLLSAATTIELTPQHHLNHPIVPKLLSTLQERLFLFEQNHIHRVLALNFERLKMLSPQEYLTLMVQQANAAHFVCGEDHRFGCNAEGDVQLLEAWCKQEGIGCSIVPKLREDSQGLQISSSRIRDLLTTRDFKRAYTLAGHGFVICGEVQSGLGRGRKMGFPTLNMAYPAPPKLLIEFGVYAGYAHIGTQRLTCAVNFGFAPTVRQDSKPFLEVHILDNFSESNVVSRLTIEVVEFVRAENKFTNIEQLQNQITEDCRAIKRIVADLNQ